MGDSGSLVIGLLLGTLTIRTTFLPPDLASGAGWYAVFAPVIVLGRSAVRSGGGQHAAPDARKESLRRRHQPFQPSAGGARHVAPDGGIVPLLDHRRHGGCRHHLAHAPSTFVAILVFLQTLLILGVVMLLEQHPLPMKPDGSDGEKFADLATKSG